jgi:hypothetical protein
LSIRFLLSKRHVKGALIPGLDKEIDRGPPYANVWSNSTS